MSEKEKKVNEQPQVTLNEQNINDVYLYPGIKLIKHENFIPRKDLKKEDIKKFSIVEVEISSIFKQGKDPRINFKVFPFVEKPYELVTIQGRKINNFSRLFRLNGDISNNIRLSANEYTGILLASKLPVDFSDKVFSLLKYARFITGISLKDNKRYNKVQLFLAFDNVKTLWLSDIDLRTISALYTSNLIDEVIFYEVSSSDLELEETNVDVELI